MWRTLPSLLSQVMPLELTHEILRSAWATITGDEGWGTRWDFFRDMSLVSRGWASVMTEVILRRVTIGTRRDFETYLRIIRREFGVDVESKDVERVHPSAYDFFQCSDLYITLTDWASVAAVFSFDCDYTRIPHYVPNPRYIDVTVKELPSNDGRIHPYSPLFRCLSQYYTVSDLSLRWTYTHINRYVVPQHHVLGVTYLRLVEFPRCNCQNYRHLIPGTGVDGFPPVYFPQGSHRLDCFSHLLLTLFPDLRHLHLDTPYILKNLKILPRLTLLTLEVPPVHYLPKLGYYSSLMSWNVVSAVKSGLMRRTDEDAERKKIVVNCGPRHPMGWSQALSVCAARGVDLELHPVYEVPDTAPLIRERPITIE